MLIDLHAHSTMSDGTDTPTQLIAAADRAGLAVVALTDHDTTAGWAEVATAMGRTGESDGEEQAGSVAELGKTSRLRVVPGMEVSCEHRGVSVHVLSYLHDPAAPGLLAEVQAARESRVTRAQRMVELLAVDVDLTWEEVCLQVGDGATVGRPHIADALVAKAVVRDREEAFEVLLSSRGPYYVRHYALDPVRAVQLITDAGGVAVLAHPMARRPGQLLAGQVLDELIEELAGVGLAGLEVHHRDHDAQARRQVGDLADGLGLLVTGSSDYHGTGKPNRLGEHSTTPEVFQQIVDRATGSMVIS